MQIILPFDILIYIACLGGGHLNKWKYIFRKNDIEFIAVTRIQKKWRESTISRLIPGRQVLVASRITHSFSSADKCIVVKKSRTFDNKRIRIFCVQVVYGDFMHFKYIQFPRDPNYRIKFI